MQAITNSGYPRNLSFLSKKLHGYSRNNFRISSLNATVASSSQIVSVDLPSNSLVDLSTLCMFFTGSTTSTGGFSCFSRNIESVIERIEVEINGNIVSTGCSFLNHLYQILYDTQCGSDAKNRRSILQNGADGVIPSADVKDVQYCIQTFPGFIDSLSPGVLDTSLVGNCRMRITLANSQCLISTAANTSANYTLSNIFFSVDVISIDDGMFRQIHDKFLSSGGVYEYHFNNYLSFTSTGSSLSQSVKFSLSTQSLNRLWGTFVPGQRYAIKTINGVDGGNHFFDPVSKSSSYFTRIGGGTDGSIITWGSGAGTAVTYTMNNWQFNCNGTYCPNWTPSAEQAFGLLMANYGMDSSTGEGCTPALNSMGAWLSSMWCSSARFDHGTDGTSLIAGMNTLGNQSGGYWSCQGQISGAGAGAPSTIMGLVFAQITSSLTVGAGRQCVLVL
jgi:hypothetical protein